MNILRSVPLSINHVIKACEKGHGLFGSTPQLPDEDGLAQAPQPLGNEAYAAILEAQASVSAVTKLLAEEASDEISDYLASASRILEFSRNALALDSSGRCRIDVSKVPAALRQLSDLKDSSNQSLSLLGRKMISAIAAASRPARARTAKPK